jgi:hypothetical protein
MNRGLRFRNISNINSNKDKFRNPRFNSDNSNKDNPKEGGKNTKSRMTRRIKKLPSMISVG